MNRRHVVCVGEVMVDTLARLPEPLVTGSDVPAVIRLLGGGSAANTACWLAAAGTTTTLIARVGADPLGADAIRDIQSRGVRGVIVEDPAAPTGNCIVLVSPDGERTMVPDAGANLRLAPQDIQPADFAADRHLHVSGYLLFGAARSAGTRALDLARETGMTISVDVASAAPIRAMGTDAFLDVLGSDLLLLANIDEAAVLTGHTDAARGARELARRFGAAVVKCGPEGAVWSDGVRLLHEPAAQVQPIDTTGAGDAFAAGLLGALLGGADPDVALRAGNALGRDACLRLGGRPPAPNPRIG